MCFDPVTLGVAQLLLGAASSFSTYAAQADQAAQQQARYDQNYQNSLAAGRDQHNQLTLRAMQENDAAAQKEHEIAVEGATREAEVNVSAAGGGVGGLSVDALLSDVALKVAQNRSITQKNANMTAQQLAMQQKGVVTQTESRINSVAQGSAPNPLEPILKTVGSGLKLFSEFDTNRGG